MSAALVSQFMPYGAPELKRAARPHMVRALVLSSLLVTAAFALAWSLSQFIVPTQVIEIPVPPTRHDSEHFDILKPPPPPITPPAVVVRPPSKVNAVDAVPVPKKDDVVPPDQTIKGQGENPDLPVTTGPSTGIKIENGTGDQPVNRFDEVAFVDRYPEAITRTTPTYPDIARQAGVEGTVVVYVLIGKEGKVREVKLHPDRHVPMLDEAALQAARRWTFEPALSSGHAVAVWVQLPFKFSLHTR